MKIDLAHVDEGTIMAPPNSRIDLDTGWSLGPDEYGMNIGNVMIYGEREALIKTLSSALLWLNEVSA